MAVIISQELQNCEAGAFEGQVEQSDFCFVRDISHYLTLYPGHNLTLATFY